MNAIIGYTGFVGSNLDMQYIFEKKYNSKNINDIKGKKFDTIFCAGVSAIKWFANQNSEKDIQGINNLIDCLKEIKCNRFILISTIDIYNNMINVDEDVIPDKTKQDTYGKNRYYLENWIRENFENHLIVRLPALFGTGLKKNFIYDLMNPIPAMIIESKMLELKNNLSFEDYNHINKAYIIDENKSYIFNKKTIKEEKNIIFNIFKNYGFTSLSFTDSRSSFPFYFLDNLKKDIDLSLNNGIKTINLSVEPITCRELAKEILNLNISNERKEKVCYDMLSKYSKLWEKNNRYLYSKNETIEYLKEYFKREGY